MANSTSENTESVQEVMSLLMYVQNAAPLVYNSPLLIVLLLDGRTSHRHSGRWNGSIFITNIRLDYSRVHIEDIHIHVE